MQRAPLAIATLLLISCTGKSGATGGSPTPDARPLAGRPTAALIQRPEVAALVDDLAKEKRLESSHVGAAGAPSSAYAKFVAITAKATEGELVALLEHQNAVVRGYAAQHVARELPARVG